MLYHWVQQLRSTYDRYTCAKCILCKKLKEIKPTKSSNGSVVEEICVPQNSKNYKSGLSAHSSILLSHLLLCLATQFGTIKARTTAVPVLNVFYAKTWRKSSRKYFKRMRIRGDMAATKSTNPTKNIENVQIFTENIIICNVVASNSAP